MADRQRGRGRGLPAGLAGTSMSLRSRVQESLPEGSEDNTDGSGTTTPARTAVSVLSSGVRSVCCAVCASGLCDVPACEL
jgi:hypothetical protein